MEDAGRRVMEEFGFCPSWGFLEPAPLETLGSYFSPWSRLVRELDSTRADPTASIREKVEQLPLLDHERLESKAELQLAHTLLSCLGMSYVFEEPSCPRPCLPEVLAVPWTSVSTRLAIPPIIIHSTISLSNWRKIDPSGPFELSNLTTIFSLDTTRDLEAFFMVPLLVELASLPAVKAILTAQELASQSPVPWPLFPGLLAKATTAVEEMRRELGQLHTSCDPATFYHVHRPLLSGWKDNPLLPGGLTYLGVSPEPLELSGGSAAQSAALQLLDAGLGVEHQGAEGEFLATMRESYMPPNQRGLIERVREGPSLHKVCSESPLEEVREGFEACLEELVKFRTDHLVLVARYRRRPHHNHRRRQVHPGAEETGEVGGAGEGGGEAPGGAGHRRHAPRHLPQEDQGRHEESRWR